MTHSLNLTRRAALGLAAGGACAALAPSPLALADTATTPGSGTLAEKAVRLFSNQHQASSLGRACLHCSWEPDALSLSGNETPDRLVEALFGDQKVRLERAGDEEVHDWLRNQVRRDFSNGDTIRVKGWVLARTETMLYALVSTV